MTEKIFERLTATSGVYFEGTLIERRATPFQLLDLNPGGPGTPGHLCMEYFALLAGFQTVPVAYRGNTQLSIDLVAGRKTYYLADGDFEEVEVHKVVGAAMTFSAEGVEKAVRAIQRQEIAYRGFCRQIAEAGCVGYFVSLAGRRAVYYGRAGDEHVEWFPGAKQ